MNQDLDFFVKHTGLSSRQVLTLLEEDFDLVVDSLNSQINTLDNISLPLFIKLTIYNKSKQTNFSLSEKAYVADAIIDNYPQLLAGAKSHYLIDNQPLQETQARFYLVLTGVFPKFLIAKHNKHNAPALDFYIDAIKIGFRRASRHDLSEHIDTWIPLLNNLKLL